MADGLEDLEETFDFGFVVLPEVSFPRFPLAASPIHFFHPNSTSPITRKLSTTPLRAERRFLCC